VRRRLLNLVTGLSLLLSVAVVALWVRSESTRDVISWGPGRDYWRFSSDDGRIRFTAHHVEAGGTLHASRGWRAPLWMPAAAAAVLPLAWASQRLRRRRLDRRRRQGLCPSCGYDLRATPGR
jgi:hypothetical protein